MCSRQTVHITKCIWYTAASCFVMIYFCVSPWFSFLNLGKQYLYYTVWQLCQTYLKRTSDPISQTLNSMGSYIWEVTISHQKKIFSFFLKQIYLDYLKTADVCDTRQVPGDLVPGRDKTLSTKKQAQHQYLRRVNPYHRVYSGQSHKKGKLFDCCWRKRKC